MAGVAELGENGFNGFADGLGLDLAGAALVGAGSGAESLDAFLFVERIPGLDGAPGKDMGDAVLIVEGAFCDLLNAGFDGVAGCGLDGADHPELEIDADALHGTPFLG
ncbi:MAG: hypothetical protein JJU05_19505 [Verrucomicrobia bacterium]|nr:hypothetical protein [Verrucomicrobiota bacterium]